MKDKLIIGGFCFILGFFFLYSLIDSDTLVSFSERRTMATLPKLEVSSIPTGKYFEKMNEYLTDQFPFRNQLRRSKALFVNSVYQKNISHDAYRIGNEIYQLEPTVNEKSVTYFTNKLNEVADTHFKNKKVFYAIIPDKNYYVEVSSFPKMDYPFLYQTVREGLNKNFEEIDLRPTLNLDSYYRTDLHWRQEQLEEVVSLLQNKLQLEKTSFPRKQESYFPFYGAYYSKSSGSVTADTIQYLFSGTIENTEVYNYEKKRMESVYEKENLKNIDSYDIFLSGATPILILNNEESSSDRELILFRDSFSSSLAPLLLDNYQKITMIDLRYFSSKMLSEVEEIDFSKTNQDILFLYSVPIINQSFTLK